MKIVLNVPDRDTPGFAKRMYQAARFQRAAVENNITPELWKEMCELLSNFIKLEDAPEGMSNFDAIWEHASEAQITELVQRVSGGAPDIVPPTSAATTVAP